jgi:hypothetical protein
MKKVLTICCLILLPVALGGIAKAQTRRAKKPAKVAPIVLSTPVTKSSSSTADTLQKRNERPAGEVIVSGGVRNDFSSAIGATSESVYFYEFTRPGFTYSRILIEHDDIGKGRISFVKDGSDEIITDPISISVATLAKLTDAFTALDFLASTEVYQHSRDYSHMGNTRITVKKDGRERTAKYNWTDNKAAKSLMDEYRRIANEYTWKFEISVARENQPLQTPGMMEAIDSYIKRGEVSDPLHLLPFLTELSTDERLPLMARNHAVKLIKRIGTSK